MSSSNIQIVTKTADASAVVGRSRLLGVYYTCTSTGSSLVLKDGTTSGGASIVTLYTPAAAGQYELYVPDRGILFETGIYIDVADVNVTSVTLLFEGGAAA